MELATNGQNEAKVLFFLDRRTARNIPSSKVPRNWPAPFDAAQGHFVFNYQFGEACRLWPTANGHLWPGRVQFHFELHVGQMTSRMG